MTSTLSSKKKKVLIIIGMISFIVIGSLMAFFVYVGQYYHAHQMVNAFFENNSIVNITYKEENLIIKPNNKEAKTGFIFYPGGKVDYKSYIPLLSNVAEEGYFCVIAKMPYNLAVLDANAADDVIAQHPEIEQWYIGGHSLGGAMAASYISKNSDKIKGLILLGAYSTEDLSELPLQILSIYGSNDKVLNIEKFSKARAYMPDDYKEICIEGGNHGYYGNYEEQKGDGKAEITREKQQEIAVEAICQVLSQ